MENNSAGKNAWFATEDFKAQLKHTGLYSDDSDVRAAAILDQDIEKAKHGSKNGLNACYTALKAGKLTADKYASIRRWYDGKETNSDI